MGNCLKPVMRSGVSYEEDKAEEAKPLVISTVQDQVVDSSEDCCKKRKKVRFMAEVDNVETGETIIRPRIKRSVRVKVVLTQSELKQILNQTTAYHHHHHSPPLPYSFDKVSDQILMVNSKRSRSPVICRCKCSWNPALQTIPEWGHY